MWQRTSLALVVTFIILLVMPSVSAHSISADYTRVMVLDNLAAVDIDVPHSLSYYDPPGLDIIGDYLVERFSVRNNGVPCTLHLVNYTEGFTSADIHMLAVCDDDLERIGVTNNLFFEMFPMMKHETLILYGGDSVRFTMSISNQTVTHDLGRSHRVAPGEVVQHRDHAGGGVLSFLESRLERDIESLEDDGTLPLFALVVAFLIGAVHSLGPGHGKAFAAAYLVGQKRDVKHALVLGASLTITHVLDVVVVSIVALFLSAYIMPHTYAAFLRDFAAAGIVAMGMFMLYRALNPKHRHDHEHPHSHKQTILAGIIGGLAPCPTAWVIFLSIIAIDQMMFGFLVLMAFSLGLALTITSVGVVFVKASSLLNLKKNSRLIRALPVFSSVVVMALGALMLMRVI